jgi:cell division inhibitor SepF
VGLRKTGTWLGLVEDEPTYADQLPGDAYAGDAYADDGPLDGQDEFTGQAAVPQGFQIASLRPQNFRDARTIGEYFREDIPVIFNLEGMDGPAAKRVVDFACGLTFGRRGSIERLSSRVFLLLPEHASILTEASGPADEGFFNQA